MNGKWDQRFLDLAELVSQWSKDPRTKVGAVIVRPDKTVTSLGFNGFPRGVEDTDSRYGDRDVKHRLIVHAEANAILHAREPVYGHTLYVTPLHPCSSCTGLIVQSGVSRVVYRQLEDNSVWTESFRFAARSLREAGVEVSRIG